MNRELEHVLDHRGIAVEGGGGDGIDPGLDGRLATPAETVPAKNPEGSDDSNRARRMALHDRGFEHGRKHDEITLRPCRAIEDHPLCRAVGATKQPARQSVGEPTGVGNRLLVGRSAEDAELRALLPRCRIRTWLEDRAAAQDAPLVNIGAHDVIDLFQQQRSKGVRAFDDEAALLELLGESSSSRDAGVGHWSGRYRRRG